MGTYIQRRTPSFGHNWQDHPWRKLLCLLQVWSERNKCADQIMSKLEEAGMVLEKTLKDIERQSQINSCQCEYHMNEWL